MPSLGLTAPFSNLIFEKIGSINLSVTNSAKYLVFILDILKSQNTRKDKRLYPTSKSQTVGAFRTSSTKKFSKMLCWVFRRIQATTNEDYEYFRCNSGTHNYRELIPLLKRLKRLQRPRILANDRPLLPHLSEDTDTRLSFNIPDDYCESFHAFITFC